MDLTRRKMITSMAGAGAALALPALSLGPRPALGQTGVRPDRPNIILIVVDTLRRDHVGIYGNPWIQTPAFDQLGRQSVRFTRSVPEAMPTIPARRAVHTGMRTFPFRNWDRRKGNFTGVWGWQHIPEDQPTLAEQLVNAGYETILVTDIPHQFTASMNFSRGFNVVQWIRGQEGDRYRPYWQVPYSDLEQFQYRDASGEAMTSKNKEIHLANELRQYLANIEGRTSEDEHFAAKVFRTAAEQLEGIPRERPFFITVNSFDPHEPWDAPRRYSDAYFDGDWDEPEPVSPRYGSSDYLTDRQLKRMRALYAGEVTMTDTWLGHFMQRLHDMALLDDTVILFTSDHGMALGEHGAVGKPSFALWPEMTDVPYFLRHPNGTGAGTAHDEFASTHDLAPTILSLAGLEPSVEPEGADLTPFLAGAAALSRPHFTSGLNDYVWASNREHALIARNDGTDAKLYDLTADPLMMDDIAADRPDLVRAMYELVLSDAGGMPLPQYG